MKLFGRSRLSQIFGDFVVYRNIKPVDTRLPALENIRQIINLPEKKIPRKSDPDYARLLIHILQSARALDEPGKKIQRLIFIGDTRLNDSAAFANLCQTANLPGLAFIASENIEPPKNSISTLSDEIKLFLTNRWGALPDFSHYLFECNFAVDEFTAVLVDLDKTAIGARGRNAQVIDRARIQAVNDTVADFLGDTFDVDAFRQAYDLLNQQDYHSFTLDNQDYLAYICLILGGEGYRLKDLVSEIKSGELMSFQQFISKVDVQRKSLAPQLVTIHDEIFSAVRCGDPTPFKAFRRNEYMATVGLMGYIDDDEPVEVLLQNEIVITNEVRQQVLTWKENGALIFGLSDKPDEASIPLPQQISQGYQPIHNTETHVIGSQ
jgi:hypothetical protein